MHREVPTAEVGEATPEEATDGACLSEEEALALMESKQILVCGDDYKWWHEHGYSPSAGNAR